MASSSTRMNEPPLSRTARSALIRSRGSPATMLSATDWASTGSISQPSNPRSQASTKGDEPDACTPTIRGICSIQPRASRSLKPLCTPPMMHPSPTGTNITSGADQASCSHTSKATVFFPSLM